MALPAGQYRTLRDLFLGMLSVDGVGPTDADVLSFYRQLMLDSAGAVALSSARNFLCGEVFRRILSGDASNPSDADVVSFWTQLATGSGSVTPAGQTPAYRKMRNALRAAISCEALNPSDSDVLSYFSPYAYSFAADTRVMARYRASDGLADLSSAGLLGPLVANGGAVASGADADGNTVWQLRTGSGGFLKTAAGATTFLNPITVILIAKAGPSPSSSQCWATTFGVASSIFWASPAGIKLTGASSAVIASTPANENVFYIYEHNNASMASVNGAAFSALTVTGGNVGIINQNLSLGADPSGSFRADVDIAEVIIYEGPLTAAFIASFTTYARARYPSRSVSATPPAAPSPWQASRGSLPVGAFDFILIGGQSNNDGLHSLSGTPTAAGANAYVFKPDNTIIACPAMYGDPTGAIDGVNINALAGIGGSATAMAATYTASTGRNLVIVPVAVGGTGLRSYWYPSLVRGNKQRNCLYGVMLDKARNLIALGGTLRGLDWYQGETEAINGGVNVTTYQADLDFFLTSLFADLGLAQKVVIQTIANTVSGATAPNLAAIQSAQAANAISGQRVVLSPSSGPYEADNLHLAIAAQNARGVAVANAILAAGW